MLAKNIPARPTKCKRRLPAFSINGKEMSVITTIVRPIRGVAFSTLLIPDFLNISLE